MIETPAKAAVVDMLDELAKGLLGVEKLKTAGCLITHACTAFAVESQELYLGKTPDARSILHLAQVAGAGYLMCRRLNPTAVGYFPRPAEWKGQIDKHAHHIRILLRAGITHHKVMGGKDRYLAPMHPEQVPGGSQLRDSDWKHVNDAIGLAQYAADTYQYQTAKAKALLEARK